jgi:alkyldihydroxyacetonephosphate synthase
VSASSVVIDRTSLLVEVDASVPVDVCEAALGAERLTLDVDAKRARGMTVAAWLEAGAPGARDPWLDPADHVVAGLEATLPDGKLLSVRPAPRRAVGPDLVALVVGMNGRYAKVTRAWLRVHPVDVVRPSTHPVAVDRAPPLDDGEKALLDAIARELGAR